MIDLFSLLKETGAYKTVLGDKIAGRLSHAYLILTQDGEMLEEYLKIIAKLIVCEDSQPCCKCRFCTLVDQKAHSDVYFYPMQGDSVLTADVNHLISESYVKPIESDKKVFVINNAQTMNGASQNKLLKTLEEPPKGVHIIIGATTEFSLLPTVKSRVKKLEIPAFNSQKIFDALKGELLDEERLKDAVACGDGTVGKALSLYSDENLSDAIKLAEDLLINMKSSANVFDYSLKVTSLKGGIEQFLSVTELFLRDLLVISQGKGQLTFNKKSKNIYASAVNFSTGAILNALEKITEANERIKFNANPTMLVEWLLFQILEGKYKWQKL